MTLRNIGIIHAVLVLIAFVQNGLYLQRLPERVATHFNGAGEPDGWMSRTAAVWMMGGFQIALPMLFIGIGLMLPLFPDSSINIPNREFWLHPDRRRSVFGFLNRAMALFSILISLFFIAINHITFLANSIGGGKLDMVSFSIVLVAFLLATTGWVVWLYRSLRLPRSF